MPFNAWLESEAPTIVKYYLFNYTNGDQVSSGRQSPKLIQLGPYVFIEKKVRSVINISADQQFVYYKDKNSFYFDQKASGKSSLNDVFIVPNIPAFVSGSK